MRSRARFVWKAEWGEMSLQLAVAPTCGINHEHRVYFLREDAVEQDHPPPGKGAAVGPKALPFCAVSF